MTSHLSGTSRDAWLLPTNVWRRHHLSVQVEVHGYYGQTCHDVITWVVQVEVHGYYGITWWRHHLSDARLLRTNVMTSSPEWCKYIEVHGYYGLTCWRHHLSGASRGAWLLRTNVVTSSPEWSTTAIARSSVIQWSNYRFFICWFFSIMLRNLITFLVPIKQIFGRCALLIAYRYQIRCFNFLKHHMLSQMWFLMQTKIQNHKFEVKNVVKIYYFGSVMFQQVSVIRTTCLPLWRIYSYIFIIQSQILIVVVEGLPFTRFLIV